jgi:hypothetical protein
LLVTSLLPSPYYQGDINLFQTCHNNWKQAVRARHNIGLTTTLSQLVCRSLTTCGFLRMYQRSLTRTYICFHTAFATSVAQWGLWSIWSACSATCDDGKRTRTRTCGSDRTEDSCPGSSLQEESCVIRHCPGRYCCLLVTGLL